MRNPTDRPAPRRHHFPEHDLGAIFIGGVAGSLVRTALARGFPVAAGQWPWPTFAVNILAAAMLGYLIASTSEREAGSVFSRSLVGVGLCGALSTFSTMMAELLGMLESSRWELAGGYAGASLAAGLGAVVLASRWARGRGSRR